MVLGRITGLFGIQGEVKIHSYTQPRDQIFSYCPWYLRQGKEWIEKQPRRDRPDNKSLIAVIDGTATREEARDLVGVDIAVRRDQLPPLPEGEFYQADLIGLEILDTAGNRLGVLMEFEGTGANDVMVIAGERKLLVPFVMGEIVKNIDLDNGCIRIDWNPEYV